MLARNSLDVLKRGIDQKLFSGAAYALVSKRQSGGVGTLGRLAFDRETDRVNRDTLFDAASLTKPLVTAVAVLQLAADGRVTLDAPVTEYLSAPAQTELTGVTVRQLLMHTSGLPPVPGLVAPGTALIDAALNTPPLAAPGATYVYSDTGYIILGGIVQSIASRSIGDWFGEAIKPALHLTTSGFSPDLSLPIAATSEDESLDGLPHDPLARSTGGIAGHAGLFLNADDLAAYLRALLGSGRSLLPTELFTRLFSNEIAGIGSQSLAFFTQGNAYLPHVDGFSAGAVGHSGFTGCFLLVDRENETAVGLLTNSVLSAAADAKSSFLQLRSEWLAAAAADLRLTGR